MIIYIALVTAIALVVAFFVFRCRRLKKGGSVPSYGIQTFDHNGNVIFDSTMPRLRLIGEYIVSAKSEMFFTYSIKDTERLVGWLLPIDKAPTAQWEVFLRVENKKITCSPALNGIKNPHQYKLIIGVY